MRGPRDTYESVATWDATVRSCLKRLCTVLFAGLVISIGVSPAIQYGARAGESAHRKDANRYGSQAEREQILDALFTKLRDTKDGFIAQTIIQQIWLTWHQSGRRDIDDLLSRAKINASEGEFEAALKKLDRLIQSAPDFAEAWNGRATVYFQMGRYKESLADIAETLKREPRHFGALAGQGRIYLRQENYQAALGALNEALRHNPFMSEGESLIPVIRKKLGIRDL
ncbi:MAG: tetratricopeptide repeat protein [Alphaproteobacteria bacterium]|nr:tetratricopeptide repeat protein [Alphaproteobacteria bacterium]